MLALLLAATSRGLQPFDTGALLIASAAIALLITARLLPGVRIEIPFDAAVFAGALVLADKAFVTLIASFGRPGRSPLAAETFSPLFAIVLNTLVFALVPRFTKRIQVSGFAASVLAAMLTAIVSVLALGITRFGQRLIGH